MPCDVHIKDTGITKDVNNHLGAVSTINPQTRRDASFSVVYAGKGVGYRILHTLELIDSLLDLETCWKERKRPGED